MTSTSFNIGITNSKNSSRVIKPPGGGHTDIFGISGNEGITPSKRKNGPTSSISSCFQHEQPTKINDHDEKNGNATNETHEVTNGKHVSEDSVKEINKGTNENMTPKTAEKVESGPPRRRVPPGGFSSALW